MANFWSDFKAFAMKGNVVDMAIGVVVGGAFGKIVTSLVNDVIMPLVGWLVGGIDLSKLHVELKGTLASQVAEGVDKAADIVGEGEAVNSAVQAVTTEVPSVFLNYGNFIQEIVNFLIIALCIFLCIRLITNMGNKLRKKEEAVVEEAPAAPAAPVKSDEAALLEEIRDLLKKEK
ncbi:MAG: large-conductance mechanosensitive channel protein MscL [Bacteroidales bacterium]|nr:large-conductance mechanosensitive channel protein MscL [Bacteroidales bacterium]